MKKLIGLLLLFLVLSPSVFAQSVTNKLDELIQAYTNVNEFNGSVLVARNGQILLKKSYGLKNINTRVLNDTGTIYQIASVTKTFTSALVLKLIELKKLSLQDKLSKFYPGYPHGDSIIVENLLSHTSGVYNYTENGDFMFTEAAHPASEEKMLSQFKDKPLDFKPGTDWKYSNSGYSLLGYIIQKVTGMSYQQAMRKYIFEPLKMNHSGFDFAHLADSDKAVGYYSKSGKDYVFEAPLVDSSVSFAAGSIYSTVGDMYKWHLGLQYNKIINKELQDEAYRPVKHNYGYGWITDSLYGKRIVSHSGGIFGFRSNFARITDDDICVILLANMEVPGLDEITKKLIAVLYNKPYKIPVKKHAVKLPDAILKQYTGTYEIAQPHLVLDVKLEDGELVVYPVNGPRSVLAPTDTSHFFGRDEESIEISFEKNNKGEVVTMTIVMNNTRVAKKIK